MPPESQFQSALNEVRDDVKTILAYLHGEQGNNGLMTRMKVAEKRIDDHDAKFTTHEDKFRGVTAWVVGTVTTLILAIGAWFVSGGKGGQ